MGNLQVKIADFGFTKSLFKSDGSKINKTTQGRGTIQYKSPELHNCGEMDGEKVDVFALGVILYVMFANEIPFMNATPDDNIYKLIHSGDMKGFWQSKKSRA